MEKLYWGLKRWQWAAIFAMVSINFYLTTDTPLGPVAIISAVVVLIPIYYILSRITIGVYRYIKYIHFDDPIYRNPEKLQREQKYFNLVAIIVVLCILAVPLGLAAPHLLGYADVDSDNPYHAETLVVGVENPDMNQHSGDVITNALEYWESENTSDQYAGYPIDYDFRPNADDPDVVVRWVEDIEECGYHDTTVAVGCAPIVTETSTLPEPATIRVETGRPEKETVETLKHEVGHTLGLDHDDEPQEIMSIENESNLTT